jgi:response regulator RpfG family c-di-GMP phosphodiesterase
MTSACKTVIVADDDPAILTAAQNSLKYIYNVLTVPSGKTLFLLLENIRPDIILLSAALPVMDAHDDILGLLKSSRQTAHIPVILLTTGRYPASEKRSHRLEIADYLVKPFAEELLIKLIETHLPRSIDPGVTP